MLGMMRGAGSGPRRTGDRALRFGRAWRGVRRGARGQDRGNQHRRKGQADHRRRRNGAHRHAGFRSEQARWHECRRAERRFKRDVTRGRDRLRTGYLAASSRAVPVQPGAKPYRDAGPADRRGRIIVVRFPDLLAAVAHGCSRTETSRSHSSQSPFTFAAACVAVSCAGLVRRRPPLSGRGRSRSAMQRPALRGGPWGLRSRVHSPPV